MTRDRVKSEHHLQFLESTFIENMFNVEDQDGRWMDFKERMTKDYLIGISV